MKSAVIAIVFALSIPAVAEAACTPLASGRCEGTPINVRPGYGNQAPCLLFDLWDGSTNVGTYYISKGDPSFPQNHPHLTMSARNSTVQFFPNVADPGGLASTCGATYVPSIWIGNVQ